MMGFALLCNIQVLHDSVGNLTFIAHCSVKRVYDLADGWIEMNVVLLCLLERLNEIFKKISKGLINIHEVILQIRDQFFKIGLDILVIVLDEKID